MNELVGHFLMFSVVAIIFLVLPLLVGRLVRPKLPTPEKDAIYECGEPTIGTSYIQFDLRFYVVALLFIVFDVEVAFFFPWAMVYGSATQLADENLTGQDRVDVTSKLLGDDAMASGAGVISSDTALTMATFGLADILVFFGVLLVGFAYVWKRGDIDWVRAVTEKAKQAAVNPQSPPPPDALEAERKPEPAGV